MFATVHGRSIHYTKAGSGKTAFLLVHGWGGSGRSLTTLAEQLAQTHTVYTVDLPGFGASDNPEAKWSVEEYANLLSAFLAIYVKTPVVYFGHSFGGALGVYLAAEKPSSVSKLILAAPSFHRTQRKKSTAGKAIARLPISQKGQLILRKILYKLLCPRSDILNYPHLEANYRAIISRDLTSCLPKIHIPTLILWGEKDKDTPVSDAKLLHKHVPNSKLVIFENRTHNFPLKYPDMVVKEIADFV